MGMKPRKKPEAKTTVTPKKKRNFILCPTCGLKSKKLFSEMGGLQTRKCRGGHYFEVDTFFGIPMNPRRVAHTDRPFFAPNGMNYSDYVYGEFKDDPTGKGNNK